jgi:hypothetical protein
LIVDGHSDRDFARRQRLETGDIFLCRLRSGALGITAPLRRLALCLPGDHLQIAGG